MCAVQGHVTIRIKGAHLIPRALHDNSQAVANLRIIASSRALPSSEQSRKQQLLLTQKHSHK